MGWAGWSKDMVNRRCQSCLIRSPNARSPRAAGRVVKISVSIRDIDIKLQILNTSPQGNSYVLAISILNCNSIRYFDNSGPGGRRPEGEERAAAGAAEEAARARAAEEAPAARGAAEPRAEAIRRSID